MSEDTREQPLHASLVGGTKTLGKDASEGNVDTILETWDAPLETSHLQVHLECVEYTLINGLFGGNLITRV